MRYRVREPFMVIRDDPPNRFTFLTLKPGSMLRVKGDVLKSGLVDIECEGQILGAFMRDILARAELVERVTA